MKAIEHDKYENIAASDRACLLAVLEMRITAHATRPLIERNLMLVLQGIVKKFSD
jgi:hypothetical protein